MSEKYIDLHVHSDYSDGAPVEEIVESAIAKGITAVALCDHQEWMGIEPLKEAARKKGYNLEVIPGIEISTFKGKDLLGYFIDTSHQGMQKKMTEIHGGKNERAREILKKLDSFLSSHEIPIKMTPENVSKYLGNSRCMLSGHIELCFYEQLKCIYESSRNEYNRVADLVSKAMGLKAESGESEGGSSISLVGANIAEGVMKRYIKENIIRHRLIGSKGLCHVPRSQKDCMSIKDAAELIISAGGIVGIAHPGAQGLEREDIMDIMSHNVSAIEAYSSKHNGLQNKMYLELAKDLGLAKTAGSDWHGSNTPTFHMGYAGSEMIRDDMFGSSIIGELKQKKKLL